MQKEVATPSRQLMEHLFGDDAQKYRRALRTHEPTGSSSPVDQIIDAMAEAELDSYMADIYRQVEERKARS